MGENGRKWVRMSKNGLRLDEQGQKWVKMDLESVLVGSSG